MNRYVFNPLGSPLVKQAVGGVGSYVPSLPPQAAPLPKPTSQAVGPKKPAWNAPYLDKARYESNPQDYDQTVDTYPALPQAAQLYAQLQERNNAPKPAHPVEGLPRNERMRLEGKTNPDVVAKRQAAAMQSTATPPRARVVEAAPAGPTAEQLAMFASRKGTGVAYDPNSWVDRNKMNALLQGNANWSDNSAARKLGRGQQYAWARSPGATKSAFQTLGQDPELEKVAWLDSGISKLLGWGGKALRNAGFRAGSVPAGFKGQGVSNAGARRLATGRKLMDASDKIDNTPWLKNTINATGIGVGGVGAYGLGRGQGREKGIEEGLREGVGMGVASATPQDPGILGRIGQVFTGVKPQVSAADVENFLANNKDAIIQAILRR